MLNLNRLSAPASRLLRRFAADKDGVSAVEFALLLPLMLTIYFGAVEVSQGVSIDRKVTLTTRAVADLVTQVASLSTTDMSNVLEASTAVMSPFPTSNLKIVLSCVRTDSSGTSKVKWSVTRNGTARGVNTTVTLPPALLVNDSTLIWAEVTYAYTPTIGYVISGTLNLSDQMWMRPRISDTIGYGTSTCT
jgi:Flp pilus assembly protein TadG